MQKEEFFDLSNCKQGGPFCVPFSYGVAIYHATKLNQQDKGLHPQGIVCLYCVLLQCGFFDDTRSDYDKIVRMHTTNLSLWCDRIMEVLRKTCLWNEQNFAGLIQKYTDAQSKLSIERISRDDNDFLSKCETKLRGLSCKTAILCINCDDAEKVDAHSVTVTYDRNENVRKFIMKDPNSQNCCSNEKLDELIKKSKRKCKYKKSHVGDALFFSEKVPNKLVECLPPSPTLTSPYGTFDLRYHDVPGSFARPKYQSNNDDRGSYAPV